MSKRTKCLFLMAMFLCDFFYSSKEIIYFLERSNVCQFHCYSQTLPRLYIYNKRLLTWSKAPKSFLVKTKAFTDLGGKVLFR